MGACTLTSAELLPNESGMYHAKNPWETHYYKHPMKRTETEDFKESISWKITGDPPKNITIDNDGVVSGRIGLLQHESRHMVPDVPPITQTMLPDCSNAANVIGRPRSAYYDFPFTVTREYYIWKLEKILLANGKDDPLRLETLLDLYKQNNMTEYKQQIEDLPEDMTPVFVKESVSKDFKIRVIRNNHIDTKLILMAYLEADYTIYIGEDNKPYVYKHRLYIGNEMFTKETMGEYGAHFST